MAIPVYQASVSVIFEDKSNPFKNEKFDPMKKFQKETYILNRIEELNSRSGAEEIAAVLPENLINSFNFPKEPSANFDKSKFVTKQIQKSISARVKRNTDIIKIISQTNDPRLSMVLANTAAEVLQKRNLQNKRNEVSGLRKFLENQLTAFKSVLDETEKKLKEFKEANSITSLQAESSEILKRITQSEIKYNQIMAKRVSTERGLKIIRAKLAEQRQELVPTITDVSSSWLQHLKDKLIDLQAQYTRLHIQQNYSSNHPKLIQLQQEIEQTRNSLSEEAIKLAQSNIMFDPLSQINEFMTKSFSLEIELESLKAQEQALKEVVQGYGKTLKELPAKESKLANLLRNKEVNEKIYMMLLEKREEAKISEAEEIANLRIIDTAELPEDPVSPRKRLNLATGLIGGLILGIGIAFFFDSMDNFLKTSEEVEELTSWPVLANIPRFDISTNGTLDLDNSKEELPMEPEKRKQKMKTLESRRGASEAYHVLRSTLQLLNDRVKFNTILMTSLSAEEGKSTTSKNLAVSFAQLGYNVLVIDADLRRPTIHKIFGISKEQGLSDVLAHHNSNNGLQTNIKVFLNESIQDTEIENLKVLTSGNSVSNPSVLLSTLSMRWLVQELRNTYDLILIDSPPVLLVPESVLLSSMVDGVVMVIKSNKNEKKLLLQAKQVLENSNSKILGMVLNMVEPKTLYSDKKLYNQNYYG